MALIDPAPLLAFSEAAKVFQGDEKGEAQTFLNRFFAAFGYADAIAAGAVFETRVAKGSASGHTGFADLVWRSSDKPPRPGVLFEMKKRGEPLEKHRRQAFTYWERLVPNRPRYVVLCNFDWFWIYDFDTQIDEPVDRIALADLSQRATAFSFMISSEDKPIFKNNQQEITALAARRMGDLYRDLVDRLCTGSSGLQPIQVQRFVLQCVLAMFAEDRGLLPPDIFTRTILDCLDGASSYDLIGGLFLQMNRPGITRGGRFKGVDYFNGGLFSEITEIELETKDLEVLESLAREDWSQVRPAIFGSIFEGTAQGDERRTRGMHFTSEIDIMKIVRPTISHYWEAKIEAAITAQDLERLHEELITYRVLDPACGSGNFLYVAYQEMKDLEKIILDRICDLKQSVQMPLRSVSPLQFFGMDINSFAVQLAQVTMTIARKVAIDRLQSAEEALPLDTLNQNIVQQDALFDPWPQADAIIGNPPFLGSYRIRLALGDRYADRVFEKFSEAKGKVDFCTYWILLAHENAKAHNGRVGLVGTNTISQGMSKQAGLNKVVTDGAVIHNAISSQAWSGEANVHVSIVNWSYQSEKHLLLDEYHVSKITSSLKSSQDLTSAQSLKKNQGFAFVGVQPTGKGFLVTEDQVKQWITNSSANAEVLKLFSMGGNLAQNLHGKPDRWIIDFNDFEIDVADQYFDPFSYVKKNVKPERDNNRDPRAKKYWWRFLRARPELRQAISKLQFYFAVPRVSKWSIFIPCPLDWLPGDLNVVVASDDFYVLGILTSDMHRQWVKAQASTLEDRTRYTHNTRSVE